MSTPRFETLINQFVEKAQTMAAQSSLHDAIRDTAVEMFNDLPLSTKEAILNEADHYISEDIIEFVPLGYGPAACLLFIALNIGVDPNDLGVNMLDFNDRLEWTDVAQLIKKDIADFNHYFVATLTLCIDQANQIDFISLIVLDDKKQADQALIYAANSYLDGRFTIMPTGIAEVDFAKFTTLSEVTGLKVFEGLHSFLTKK